MSSLHSLLSPLTTILASAGFSSSYSVRQTPYSNTGNMANRYLYLPQSASEKIIEPLLENIQGEAALTLEDDEGDKAKFTFTIHFRTVLFPVTTTQFRVLGASEAFKPPMLFAEVGEVREYILFATSCAIAQFFTKSPETEEAEKETEENTMENTINQRQPGSGRPSDETSWHTTVHSNVIRQAIPNTDEVREVSFAFENADSTPPEKSVSRISRNVLFPSNEADRKLSLRIERKYKYKSEDVQEENRRMGGTSVWMVDGGETKSLREVVEGLKKMDALSVPIRFSSDR